MGNLHVWVSSICALLALILGLVGKILWGLRCYERRLEKLEQGFVFCQEQRDKTFQKVTEELKHEQSRRDQLWDRFDDLADMIGTIKADVAFLRGAQEHRRTEPGG